ncbi:hypothetical protein BC936DRAFT_145898 [Jimgerdemannia flammicorona]|uniref:Uncharacterized protein n=2 Tax=Jimgerdemannia flammicorona TaxID=994334 RepID=A0A433D8V3_9FUNG|nr:hypothetical protein BC936DRAFT_145898 [Jimgerdemannia flammicorona]RUS30200.1 hypothetical protein BC938DRAFT_479736 [Jimgerdemannia flammicorona]
MTNSIAEPPAYAATGPPRNDDYEARFRRIMDTIVELQWVFEALPAHTAQYHGLQKQLAKEKNVLTQLNDKT